MHSSIKHIVVLYTTTSRYELRAKLKNIKQDLDEHFFLCRRDHIVNVRRISSINKKNLTLTLDTGEMIDFSQRYVVALEKMLKNIL